VLEGVALEPALCGGLEDLKERARLHPWDVRTHPRRGIEEKHGTSMDEILTPLRRRHARHILN
jgi:hypothetical protein